ncbi:3471_t:CDS:2, partial [Racocetra persica]
CLSGSLGLCVVFWWKFGVVLSDGILEDFFRRFPEVLEGFLESLRRSLV